MSFTKIDHYEKEYVDHHHDSALSVTEGVADQPIVNPYFVRKKKHRLSTEEYVKGILEGNITTLSQAITLIESSNPDHYAQAQEIIERCLPHAGRSVRIGITGVPGAGKSTFIGLITREIHPLHRDEAPVLFRGDARVTLADIKRALGVVSSTMQDQIRVHVPAQDIVAGGLFGSLGIPQRCTVTDGQRARARAIMSELGIGDLAERDILTLSTGQARRVLIARALVHDPDVLIFDEPCTGLDPEGMYYVRQTMSALARAGRPVLLVTHYPEDIAPEIQRLGGATVVSWLTALRRRCSPVRP